MGRCRVNPHGYEPSCFNNILMSSDLLSFLRYFFSISILYGLVFKSLFSIPILYGLVFKPFSVELPYGSPYPYYMVLSLSPFWVESLCSYPYIWYSHIYLSPFGRTSLSSIDSNGISQTISFACLFLLTHMVEDVVDFVSPMVSITFYGNS